MIAVLHTSISNRLSLPQYHLETSCSPNAVTQHKGVWQEKRSSLQLRWMGISEINPVKKSALLIPLRVLKIIFLCIFMVPTGLFEDM